MASAALHLALGGLAVVLLTQDPPDAPSVLRMRFVSPGGGVPEPARPGRGTLTPPVSRPAPASAEPSLPGWQSVPLPAAALPSSAPAPAVLDELLVPSLDPENSPEPDSSSAQPGWTGPGGLGYSPPPLPPPGLVPPQGASWSLILSVPGGGGFARAVEGLNSGQSELDRWLDEYLRTVSFPSSPDGLDYQIRWSLRLESGRPQ